MTALYPVHAITKWVSALSAIGWSSYLKDDDIIDRINHRVMYGILIAFGAASGVKQFVGEPIFCWLPVQWSSKRHYKAYANNYCWVQPLYAVDWDKPIPADEEERFLNDVGFYRWATVIFVVLAFFYRVPNMLWHAFKDHSGLKLSKISSMTLETALMEQEKRDVQLGHVAEFMHRWITARAVLHGSFKRAHSARSLNIFGKRSGRYLVFLYLCIKVLYLLNVVIQFYAVSAFLKLNFWRFGIDAMTSYMETGDWEDHHNFPRVGFCDLKLYNLINLNTHTIQCVLTINLFLEKMFLFVWFASVIMLIVNTFSFLKWAWFLTMEKKTLDFLLTYSGILRVAAARGGVKDHEMQSVRRFARDYLRPDGVFVLRMVAANTTELLTFDLFKQVWLKYKQGRLRQEKDEDE